MPDFGDFKRGLAQRAKQVAQQVNQIPATVGADPRAGADETASAADVADEAGRLQALLQRHRPGPGPVRGRWALGVGDLLAEHPRVPAALRGMVRQLDRYGGVAITEQTIEFDHDTVEWSSVTEVRTRNLVDYLLSDAVAQQLNTLPLPWFPGRRRLLDALSNAVLTLLVATAKQQLDRHVEIRIPAEVRYRGALRKRELAPGVLAALVLADPAVNACLVATAQAHGITVAPADDERMTDAAQRAETLRAKLGGLEENLRRRAGVSAPPPDPGRPAPAPHDDHPRPPQIARPSGYAAPQPQPPVADPYGLADQGENLIRWAGAVAGDRAAELVASEVQRVRRPDGALILNDVSALKSVKDGPLTVLRLLLAGERLKVTVWAELNAGLTQKRSVRKEIEAVYDERGLRAAVDSALGNPSTRQPNLAVLRDSLAARNITPIDDDDYIASQIVSSLRKWRPGRA